MAHRKRPCRDFAIRLVQVRAISPRFFYQQDPAHGENRGWALVPLLLSGFHSLAQQFAGCGRPEEAGNHWRNWPAASLTTSTISIMGIQSNAEAMLAQPSLMPQARDSLVNIIRACSTGASLTRSLLGYAKRQPLTMAPFKPGRPRSRCRADRRSRLGKISCGARKRFSGSQGGDSRCWFLFEPKPLPAQPYQERSRSDAGRRHHQRALGG